jgi:hypothetical protein
MAARGPEGRATLWVMKVELLYVDGCPGHEAFLARLEELLGCAGVDVAVEQRRVAAGGLRGTPPDEWVLDALTRAASTASRG